MLSVDDYNRIYWHSRRGMLELDLVLMPFVEKHYKTLSPGRQEAYIKLLDCEDQDMFGWFLQHKIPEDPAIAEIVSFILELHGKGG